MVFEFILFCGYITVLDIKMDESMEKYMLLHEKKFVEVILNEFYSVVVGLVDEHYSMDLSGIN